MIYILQSLHHLARAGSLSLGVGFSGSALVGQGTNVDWLIYLVLVLILGFGGHPFFVYF